MIQDGIVFIIIAAALFKTGWELSKILHASNQKSTACGECRHCELKKTLIHHEQ